MNWRPFYDIEQRTKQHELRENETELLRLENAGLENPIYAAPSWGHWCGT